MAQTTQADRDSALAKDIRRGLTGVHKEVAQILHNLAKTARSFGFYAKDNRAIAMFSEELHAGFDSFMSANGAIRLLVGADRFLYQDKEVYYDADRESGMPFRLYRDGVRAIQFKPGLSREELESLLDILSKRASTGRDAEEEDLVTMLWQSSFEHVTYSAVEGFTHDLHATGSFDEEGRPKADSGEAIPRMMERISGKRETLTKRSLSSGKLGGGRTMSSFRDKDADAIVQAQMELEEARLAEAGGGRRRGPKHKVRATGDTAHMAALDEDGDDVDENAFTGAGVAFAPGLYPGSRDYPLVLRGGMAEVQFSPIEFEDVARLRQDLDEENEVGLLHLLDYCFELCLQEREFFGPDDFRAMLAPIRRYLVRHRDLAAYDRLLRYLRRISGGGVYPEHLSAVAAELLQECSTGDALGTLVASASGDEEAENLAWDILQQLLPNLDPTEILKLLGHGMTEHMANILAGTLIRRTGSELDLYREALKGGHIPAALASLRCLATLRTPDAVEIVERAIAWPEPVVRRAVVRILGRVPITDRTPRVMKAALGDPDPDVRDEALIAIDRQGEGKLARTLWHWFVEAGFKSTDSITRDRCVQLVGELDPIFATRVLSEKLNVSVRARMGGLVGTPEVIEWNRLAVEGLAVAATPEAIEKLREVRTKGGEDFRELVTRRLVDARRKGPPA